MASGPQPARGDRAPDLTLGHPLREELPPRDGTGLGGRDLMNDPCDVPHDPQTVRRSTDTDTEPAAEPATQFGEEGCRAPPNWADPPTPRVGNSAQFGEEGEAREGAVRVMGAVRVIRRR